MARQIIAMTFALFFVLAGPMPKANSLELIMFESDSCEWCEIWNNEIGPIYSKTTEGKQAPLRRVDVFEKAPKDIKHINQGRFTPTFVLVDEGKEIGRIRGYPGEDFFWGMLGELLEKAKKAARKAEG